MLPIVEAFGFWKRRVIIAGIILVVAFLALASGPAHGTTSTTFEAESLNLPSSLGQTSNDSTASADRTLFVWSNATASKRITTSSLNNRIYIRARGDQCDGAPQMTVKVDGIERLWTRVGSTNWKTYTAVLPPLPAGQHTVEFLFTNDYKVPGKCDRNLRVDKASFATQTVALGVLVDGGSAAGIDRYTKMAGKAPAHVLFFRNWEHDKFPADNLNQVVSRGAMPIVTWVPKDPAKGVNQPEYALKTIVRGDHDAYIRRWAKDAKAWGKTFYLRPMHEMNGNWSPWGANVNGNRPAEFIAAWRHMHKIFEQEGATNVRWVWSPNAGGRKFTDLYPGDAYVDWVALDGYNWGKSIPNSGWRSLTEIFASHYKTLTRMTDKPMMIAETASTEKGGNKAAWIRKSFLRELPYRFPRVRAVVWFNKDKVANWRVNSSSASLDAYKKVAGSPLYRARLR